MSGLPPTILTESKKRAVVARNYSTLARSKTQVKRKTHLRRCLRRTKMAEVLVSRINVCIYTMGGGILVLSHLMDLNEAYNVW